MSYRFNLIWHFLLMLVFALFSCQVIAVEPDESGVGGTGHKPKMIIDPDLIEGLDIPERLELPDVIDAIEHSDIPADLSTEAADDVAPPEQDNK